MEGASGVDDGTNPIVTTQLSAEHVAGLIRHAVHDATVTVAAHQSAAEPSATRERTDELLEPAAKATTSTTSSPASSSPSHHIARSAPPPERQRFESGVVTVAVG